MSRRIPPPRPKTPQRKPARSNRWKIAAGGALVLIVLAWVLWPSSDLNVANLQSSGSAVIAFGDSITAGIGAGAGEDYPSQLSQRIGLTVLNAGLSGDSSESALARIERDVLARDPRIVIVGLGGNDFLRRIAMTETEANLREIIRKIQGKGAMVVLLGFTFPSLSESYEDMYERVAREEKALLIPEILEDILSSPSLRSDPIHPNASGYAEIADRIAGPFAKLLRQADAAR